MGVPWGIAAASAAAAGTKGIAYTLAPTKEYPLFDPLWLWLPQYHFLNGLLISYNNVESILK